MSDETKNQPAFPQHSWQRIDKVEVGECQPGMTLRDYFAAAALQGMASSAGFQGAPWDKLAEDAYEAADAMLKTRNPV